MKEPARLGRVKEPIHFETRMLLLHPVAIIMAVGVVTLILCALLFAVTGHSAVESGGMRNFLVNGV